MLACQSMDWFPHDNSEVKYDLNILPTVLFFQQSIYAQFGGVRISKLGNVLHRTNSS